MRGEKRIDGMSTLHIPRAQPVHMGRYICLEESSSEKASIYVYVKGAWTELSPFAFSWCTCVRDLRGVGERETAETELKSRACRLQGRAEEMLCLLPLR